MVLKSDVSARTTTSLQRFFPPFARVNVGVFLWESFQQAGILSEMDGSMVLV